MKITEAIKFSLDVLISFDNGTCVLANPILQLIPSEMDFCNNLPED
ncbi:MAG TPA: hypothetical protein VKK79_26135 [Candidatus Lokiarchaeia archaeon]|nr:hypothetical protein [Candidatus Lokiarchaeia archaeon]